MGNDENLIITKCCFNVVIITLKQHYDIKTALFYTFLSTILTKAFIPEQFAVYVEICG